VNLSKCNEWPRFAPLPNAQLREEELAVALDGLTRVVLRESKVQRISAVRTRHATVSRRKRMHEPGQAGQFVGMQKLWFGFRGDLGDHSSIIPDASRLVLNLDECEFLDGSKIVRSLDCETDSRAFRITPGFRDGLQHILGQLVLAGSPHGFVAQDQGSLK